MPTFANLAQFVTTVTNKLNKPRRGVGGSEGVLVSDVLSALVDCGTYVSEGLDSIVGKANRSGDTFTGAVNFTGKIGVNVASPNGDLQFSNTLNNRKIVFYEGAANDHEFYGLGVNAGVLRYQVPSPSADHVFYSGNGGGTTSSELMRIKGNGVGYFGGRLHVGTGTDMTDQLTPLYVAGNASFSNEILVKTTNIGRGGGGIANNLRIGEFALTANTTGNGNIALGQYTLSANTTGNSNVGVGSAVLVNNTTGSSNIGIGSSVLYNNVAGVCNVGIGTYSLLTTAGSSYNTGIGYNTLAALTTGEGNTALGMSAGSTITTGFNNVVLGNNAGGALTTGSHNVILGNFLGTRIATLSNWMIFSDGAGTERFCVDASGRMGIGITTPDVSAILDLTSTTRGLLLPRMTTTERNAIAVSAARKGLLIMNITTNKLNFYNGSAWEAVTSA